ncbi:MULTISPECIES: GspE/PulE family protein [unclassified Hydrogenobaculum]|uniref:GspE/PulE family protein n=1 Tax=unclassified Hydrogenobaculum TaxID=2622382 RepID=UPI0001C50719|nr:MULTISPECIES: GspE/PulE family protein [unclassified Hydrogenobaculum]AEF18651.1 type II secretion system protein E [Hydrogenobaculum sp. 3684]AEG45939.1 type II secretion system protein E [Hydrogenobaculum sp. SHO]AGG14582.1 type II secretion system protein E [Hydrogenobaculum sp. HO]AGH92882.1 type II secretory pathway, ATPase PulE/Tfp pilus assembly pathway, ATPase PilB [Hydrogenobaculum sp. SN]
MPDIERNLRFLKFLQNEGLIDDNTVKELKDLDIDIVSYLVETKKITEQDLLNAYSKMFKLVDKDGSVVNIDKIDKNLLNLFPQDFIVKNKIIPISMSDNSVTVATYMPYIDENQIKYITKKPNVITWYTTPSKIKNIIENLFHSGSIDLNAEEVYIEAQQEYNINIEKLVEQSSESAIVKLADSILYRAVKDGASDIHIEPQEKEIVLRFRIDGMLKKIDTYPTNIKDPLVSRFKILANLDISERRKPQDGIIKIRISNKKVQLRVSTLPTIFGEKLVMRVQFPDEFSALKLETLGFEEDEVKKLKQTYTKPYGIILVVGPTGSGKTTTLYSILQDLNKEDVNIVTAEDPVEINIPGLNQVQIDEKVGRTFEAVLRSFLRQDPDIMLVGEIRDAITAEIAIKSSLTGHLVLSTLHVNDAPSTVARLIDMGIEPFLISSSLLAVSAQRLVRKLCPHCKIPYEPTKEEREYYGITADVIYKPNKQGCEYCNHLGYKGRTVIAELMFADNEIREAINQRKTTEEIREIAIKKGMKTLFQSGIIKVNKGITSLEEVLRVSIQD